LLTLGLLYFGLRTLQKYSSRIPALNERGYDFPSIGAKLIEPSNDCVRWRAVEVNHFDFVFPIHLHYPSAPVSVPMQSRERLPSDGWWIEVRCGWYGGELPGDWQGDSTSEVDSLNFVPSSCVEGLVEAVAIGPGFRPSFRPLLRNIREDGHKM
jgi:hypothetical protein